jgi:hypothetical protein
MIGKRKEGKEKRLGLLTRVGSVSTGVTRDGGEFRQVAVIDLEEVLGSPLHKTRIIPPVSSSNQASESSGEDREEREDSRSIRWRRRRSRLQMPQNQHIPISHPSRVDLTP